MTSGSGLLQNYFAGRCQCPLPPRWTFARRPTDQGIVDGGLMSAADWRHLQETYLLGELQMSCYPGAAVPKTSPLVHQFFAREGGGCETAPESIGHEQAKQVVAQTARYPGFTAHIERPERASRNGWKADVWIDAPSSAWT